MPLLVKSTCSNISKFTPTKAWKESVWYFFAKSGSSRTNTTKEAQKSLHPRVSSLKKFTKSLTFTLHRWIPHPRKVRLWGKSSRKSCARWSKGRLKDLDWADQRPASLRLPSNVVHPHHLPLQRLLVGPGRVQEGVVWVSLHPESRKNGDTFQKSSDKAPNRRVQEVMGGKVALLDWVWVRFFLLKKWPLAITNKKLVRAAEQPILF